MGNKTMLENRLNIDMSAISWMRPVHIGYAICLACGFIYFHDAAPLMGRIGLGDDVGAAFFVAFLCAKAATLLVCVRAARFLDKAHPSLLASAAAVLLTAGIAACTFVLRFSAPAFPAAETARLLALSGIILGIGDAMALLTWGRFCATLGRGKIYAFVLCSYLAALGCYTALVALPPVALMLCCAAGLCAVPFLASRTIESPSSSDAALEAGRKRDVARMLWRPVLIAAMFAFVSMGTLFVSDQQAADADQAQWTSTLMTLLVVCLMLVPTVLFRKGVSMGAAYRGALPVSAGGFLLLAFVWNGAGGIANALVAMGWLIVDVVSWCMISEASHETKSSPHVLFGLGEAIVAAASVLGVVVGYVCKGAIGSDAVSLVTAALVGMYLLSMVVLFVLKDKGSSAADGHGAGAPVAAGIDVVALRCSGVAARYGLTPRESEVLDYLARGRDMQHMTERLGVSENTVKSHVRNIYGKLGVHSKQEVIDLVNSHDEP